MKPLDLKTLIFATALFFSNLCSASVDDFNSLIVEAQELQVETHLQVLEEVDAPLIAFEIDTELNMNLAQAK